MNRVIFAGTPAFACESLRALVQSGVRPVAVLTQPDRPAGRGKKLTASPVKLYALEQKLDVMQPATLNDPGVASSIEALNADLLVVVAYGLLLPQRILDAPRVACINAHASLLPRWRGAAPVQHVILAGDTQSGVCLMQMEAGLDTGPVYARASIDVGAEETAGELHDRLAALGGALLAENLDAISLGHIAAEAQDDSLATYASKISTSDACINWDAPAEAVLRTIRAYNPVPGAWTMLNGERVKCWRAVASDAQPRAVGEVVDVGDHGVDISCASGSVRLLEVQRPGKKRITAAEFAAQASLAGQVFE
jgi:methionyl-tRNA formyltransferase